MADGSGCVGGGSIAIRGSRAAPAAHRLFMFKIGEAEHRALFTPASFLVRRICFIARHGVVSGALGVLWGRFWFAWIGSEANFRRMVRPNFGGIGLRRPQSSLD